MKKLNTLKAIATTDSYSFNTIAGEVYTFNIYNDDNCELCCEFETYDEEGIIEEHSISEECFHSNFKRI